MKYILLSLLILPSLLNANEAEFFELNPLEVIPEITNEQSTEISCFPSSYKPEVNTDVFWSAIISSPHLVNIKWSGEGLEGERTVVQTAYPQTGSQSVYIEATYDNKVETIDCGTIEIIKPPLSILCSSSEYNIKTGDSVKWSASISGRDETPILRWSGHSEVQNSSNNNLGVKYNNTGDYGADLTVTSGDITRTVYCGSVYVSSQHDDPLKVSCNANKTYSYTSDVVVWSSEVLGGNGNYNYKWRGTSAVDGENNDKVNIKYSTPGDKYAELEVCSGGNCAISQCGSVKVTDKNNIDTPKTYQTLEGACYPSATEINTNESIMWKSVLNQDIQESLFVWNGTNDLNGLRGSTQKITYKTPGIKEGSFNIRTDSGELFNFVCDEKIIVTKDDESINFISITKKISLAALFFVWLIISTLVLKKRLSRKKI